MTLNSSRRTVLVLAAISLLILLPGLFLPVLTIRGVLTPEGIATMTPVVLEQGLDEETVAALRKLMNPTMLQFLELTGGDVRQMIIDQLGPRLTAALQQGVGEIEVYTQTRSIIGAVRHLYAVGSPTAATLILLFSVVVPLTKSALVAWAMFMTDRARRTGTLRFVTAIAKWSMADVFVVALFITYLAAEATQTPPADTGAAPLLSFEAMFGPGFYWFAAYCVFSLASQQFSARLVRSAD
ncbi:MAG: paraquat-inducible protein A [Acidobacteria bacterium]|nr:paraquat-inducible protein A [Acidobacteriota bacterium]